MPLTENSQSRTWRLSPDLLGLVNQEGVFFETNPAWQTLLGWKDAEIKNMVFSEFIHPDDIEKTNSVFASLKDGLAALHFENRYRCKNGEYKWLSWVAVPEGDIFVCSARDITEAKTTARALQTKEEEGQLREQFVAILSHDLRNPLASIGAAARIAGREPHTPKTAKMYAAIENSVQRMSTLIDQTMDFASARLGGGISIEPQNSPSLEEGFQQVIDEISLGHPGRKIELDYDCNAQVRCDAARIDQALSNLLANAVTHGSQDTPIRVKAEQIDNKFVMSVTNHGTPISSDLMSGLFEPFKRPQESESLQGLGLGLFIVKEIAKAHEGTVAVSSDQTGTRFELEFPNAT
ncbi:hypothetical protein GCM10011309_27450 [Litorimonas cladophorae]|uniref:histidine kinase n=1 Tax=Litorimonas cladophorae TaxID=1220491 RepID=A0A918KTW3_9PROT|nr:PAS domain-containing sensor histidine kinase [Litorimonas cladophorae]GGX75923.1 hypothetical protein GCM10011309_27450 [Litorimonas cladophorae]